MSVSNCICEKTVYEIVRRGGGIYVGIDNLIPGEREPHAHFSSPQTGTTLCLPLSKLTPENVAARIEKSNREFGLPRCGSLSLEA